MKKILCVLSFLLVLMGCTHQEPVNGDKDRGIVIDTDYFSIEVPNYWEGLYEYQIFDEQVYGYSLILYEKESYQSMNAGHLMSISLYSVEEDYTYLPSYELLGTLETGDKTYNVLVEYPTDVQFEEDHADEYQNLSKDMDEIIETIKPKEGYNYKKA